jgi:hypothetical protein
MAKEMLTEWSDNIEKIVKDIGDTCKGYKWMNIFCAKKNMNKYNIMMYLLIVLGPISGTISTMTTSENYNYNLQVLITIFSFTSGILSASIKYSKFEERSAAHKNIAAKFSSLEGNISRQLSLNRNDRINAGEYMNWVSQSFDELFNSMPLLPESIYNKWINFAKENNLSIPQEIGKMITYDKYNIDRLCNIKNIQVNSDEKNKDSEIKDLEKNKDSEIKDLEKNKDSETKDLEKERATAYNSLPELNRYTDGKMKYELSRLYNFK